MKKLVHFLLVLLAIIVVAAIFGALYLYFNPPTSCNPPDPNFPGQYTCV
jgi:hypothetical protein